MRRHSLAATGLILTSLLWGALLTTSPAPWTPAAATVLALTLLLIAGVAVAAIVIENSRLGYRLGVALLVGTSAVAAVHSVNVLWGAGVAALALTGVAMADRRLGGWVRSEPPVAAIPQRAVALVMILLLAPGLIALASINAHPGPVGWVALGAWLVVFWYGKRWPGCLLWVRLGSLALVVLGLFAPAMGWGPRLVCLGLLATAALLAWTPQVRLAARPLIEHGSRVSIPPELAPEEIRRAAGIEDRR